MTTSDVRGMTMDEIEDEAAALLSRVLPAGCSPALALSWPERSQYPIVVLMANGRPLLAAETNESRGPLVAVDWWVARVMTHEALCRIVDPSFMEWQ